VIEGLKYMPSHEWTKVDGDVATVGITDHAQVRLANARSALGASYRPRERRERRARERRRGEDETRVSARAMSDLVVLMDPND